MKTIYIRGGDKAEPGVVVLKAHLENKGHKVVRSKKEAYDAIVCWGCSIRDSHYDLKDVPVLNGNVNLCNKYQALQKFAEADIPTPTIVNLREAVKHKYLFEKDKPWFARKVSHEKGADITLCQTWDEITNVVAQGAKDFFSVYVPHDAELRAWVYKKEVFAVYNKIFNTPFSSKHPHFGQDWERRDEWRADLVGVEPMSEYAVKAVKALKMDFGAVDLLRGTDGEYYTLEVNSMPDISSMERISGIRLANIVSKWAEEQ